MGQGSVLEEKLQYLVEGPCHLEPVWFMCGRAISDLRKALNLSFQEERIHSKQCPVIFLLFNAKLKSVVTSVLFFNELLTAYVNERHTGQLSQVHKRS